MELKVLQTGMFSSNCYILWEDGQGVIIDAGVPSEDVLEVIKENNLEIKYIIITHGHIDHICSVGEIKSLTKGQVVIHIDDAKGLTNPLYNGSTMFAGKAFTFNDADIKVKDGDKLKFGNRWIEIIHTPGHSPGGICVRVDDNVFTGDTLFYRSIGRTDLGNGDYEDLAHSIKTKLFVLDDDVVVYPGHGRSSTIGYEKNNNPYLT